MLIEKSMLIISVTIGGIKSFQMIPATKDCPYLETIFDPSYQSLRITSKNRVQRVVWVQKVDEAGIPIHCGSVKTTEQNKGFKVERMFVEEECEYFINDPREIEVFVKAIAVNAEGWEIELYPAPPVKEPEPPLVTDGTLLKVEHTQKAESIGELTGEPQEKIQGPTKL